MNLRKLSACTISVLLLGFSVQVAASSQRLKSMQMLTPDMGWAANVDTLFWTSDGGAHWKDVTPHSKTDSAISDVYFINRAVGFVLLVHSDEQDVAEFETASTHDGGATWSISSVEAPDASAHDFSGRGSLYFMDELHGWMDLTVMSGSASRPGALLASEDGGKTWSNAKGDAGKGGAVCFFNGRDGVLSGGDTDTELYVTHDASKTWQDLSLKAPAKAQSADFPTYGVPICVDESHGFLPVTFSGGENSALVLFASSDSGQTWKPLKVIPHLPELSPGQRIATGVMNSDVITATSSTPGDITLTTLRAAGVVSEQTTQIRSRPFAILQASFVNASRGWVLTSNGLLSTSDGGSTWVDVAPAGTSHILPDGKSTESEVRSSMTTVAPREKAYSSSAMAPIEKRMGFDKSYVPTKAQMKIWWTSSPYYDIGIYLHGAANKMKPDKNLNAGWLTTIEGYGWGVWSDWFGPQAPCANDQTLVKIPATTTIIQATTLGATEASNAIAAANLLTDKTPALIGNIIYYDMENYDTTNSSCRSIVQAFLNGWISQLQTSGYQAGVYGNPGPAGLDFSVLSPPPDDVWITWGPKATPNPVPIVSIWGLAPAKGGILCDFFSKPPCTNPLWSNDQRIHQYFIDHVETWGGLALMPSIDSDIIDAQVGVRSTGAKPYTAFTFVTPSCSNLGAQAGTIALFGINNLGTAVGNFTDTSNNEHAFLYSTANGCNVIPDPPVYVTYMGATGINDAGKVGIWSQGDSETYFYIYNSKTQKYSSVALGSAINGINDGDYVVTKNGPYQGLFRNTDYNGISRTLASLGPLGLNGNNVIVGSTSSSCGGLYYPISQTYVTCLPSGSAGINSSLQILVTNGGVGPNYIFDYPTGTSSIALPSRDQAFGINDYGEIVGRDYDDGPFIACPAAEDPMCQ